MKKVIMVVLVLLVMGCNIGGFDRLDRGQDDSTPIIKNEA